MELWHLHVGCPGAMKLRVIHYQSHLWRGPAAHEGHCATAHTVSAHAWNLNIKVRCCTLQLSLNPEIAPPPGNFLKCPRVNSNQPRDLGTLKMQPFWQHFRDAGPQSAVYKGLGFMMLERCMEHPWAIHWTFVSFVAWKWLWLCRWAKGWGCLKFIASLPEKQQCPVRKLYKWDTWGNSELSSEILCQSNVLISISMILDYSDRKQPPQTP